LGEEDGGEAAKRRLQGRGLLQRINLHMEPWRPRFNLYNAHLHLHLNKAQMAVLQEEVASLSPPCPCSDQAAQELKEKPLRPRCNLR